MNSSKDTSDNVAPLTFADLTVDELTHNLNRPVKVPVASLACVKVSGPQAETLLQGQLSCDVASLEKGASTFGAFCNPKGRIRSFFNLQAQSESFLLFMPKDMAEPFASELGKYAVFYQATIEQVPDYPMLALLNVDLAKLPGSPSFQQGPVFFGEKILLLHGEQDCESANQISNIQLAESNFWNLGLFQAGVPSLMSEQSEKFLPHDIGLVDLGAVNFKKGCYTGQEIVARMQYLGKLKKSLFLLRCNSAEIRPGETVEAEGKSVGELINTLKVNDNLSLALAILATDKSDMTLTLKSEKQPILEVITETIT